MACCSAVCHVTKFAGHRQLQLNMASRRHSNVCQLIPVFQCFANFNCRRSIKRCNVQLRTSFHVAVRPIRQALCPGHGHFRIGQPARYNSDASERYTTFSIIDCAFKLDRQLTRLRLCSDPAPHLFAEPSAFFHVSVSARQEVSVNIQAVVGLDRVRGTNIPPAPRPSVELLRSLRANRGAEHSCSSVFLNRPRHCQLERPCPVLLGRVCSALKFSPQIDPRNHDIGSAHRCDDPNVSNQSRRQQALRFIWERQSGCVSLVGDLKVLSSLGELQYCGQLVGGSSLRRDGQEGSKCRIVFGRPTAIDAGKLDATDTNRRGRNLRLCGHRINHVQKRQK